VALLCLTERERERERNKTQEKFYKRYSDLAFANFQLVMANWVGAFLGHFRYNTIYFRENSILAYQVCIHLYASPDFK